MNITYGVQSYAWGKIGTESLVGLYKESSDSDFELSKSDPYAEMWIGSHKKCMSYVGGEEVGEIPYLLKVLSIEKALSIQAHPTKAHAEVLHKADPANYPDDNHKPELLVALTETEALVCFRKIEEIEKFSKQHPTLAGINPAGCGLKSIMEKLLSPEFAEVVSAHKTRLENDVAPADRTAEDAWFLKLCGQFPDDTGALMVYILNLVKMLPGEGVFLKPNEPHAYLLGNGVEIMAKSDNVVRAGLTPKFKDAATLLEMMTYNTGAIDELMYRPADSEPVVSYTPPPSIPEFRLKMVKLGGPHPASQPVTLEDSPGGSVLLIVKGRVRVKSAGKESVHPAGAAVLFTGKEEIQVAEAEGGEERNNVSSLVKIEANAVVFVASTNC